MPAPGQLALRKLTSGKQGLKAPDRVDCQLRTMTFVPMVTLA